MEKPRNREVIIGEEIGYLTPIKILPKTRLGTKVECKCRCGAEVKRDLSALRAALNRSMIPACRKCNREAIRKNVKIAVNFTNSDDSYPDPRIH